MELEKVLAEALKLEADGQAFYQKMAQRADDADGKAMFEQLAADEVEHYTYIKRQADALEEGKGWKAIPEMDLVESLDAVSLVFPPDEKVPEKLGDNPDEEEALLFGLGIETESFALYHNSAENTKNPEAKKLFMQLAGAEHRHFEILMQRYESRYHYPR
jgi:rubrerythrin